MHPRNIDAPNSLNFNHNELLTILETKFIEQNNLFLVEATHLGKKSG